MTLRNRVIKAATSEGRSPGGLVTDDLIAFHRAFADGGVGMTTGRHLLRIPRGARVRRSDRDERPSAARAAEADPGGSPSRRGNLPHNSATPASWRKETGESHRSGASQFINPTSFACREITRPELATVLAQFARPQRSPVDAGFDAVELHFGHLYLPGFVPEPLINRRKDECAAASTTALGWSGEIAELVRDAVGNQIAVIAKLDMDDGLPGSIWIDGPCAPTQLLDHDRCLDALN